MRAELIYNLDDEDDKHEYKCAINATKFARFIFDYYSEVLEPYYQHGIPEKLQDPGDLLDHLVERFIEYKKHNGIFEEKDYL